MIFKDHPDDEEDTYYCDFCKDHFEQDKFDFELHQELDCEETFCCADCAKAYCKKLLEEFSVNDVD